MVGLTRLAASLAICLPLAAHGATLEVSEGRLLGAHDVMVGDALWDVVFYDGPWDFSAGTDLPATNRTDADAFSQALLGQVLLDSELGNFDSDPEATNGCENLNSCQIYTPYLVDATNTTFSVLFNQRAGGTQDDFISEGVLGLTGDFSDATTRVLALWYPVAENGAPECDIQLNQTTYIDGDTVTADIFRLANLSAASLALEWKVWLGVPEISPISVLNLGSDGSFVLPTGTDIDLGPLPLIPVTSSLPRGNYEFSCRMLDPVTGELLAEDRNFFDVQ